MNRIMQIVTSCLFIFLSQYSFAQEKKEVLGVVNQFFDAMQKNDSLGFRKVFLPEAYNYYIQETKDSLRIGARSSFDFKFRKDRIVREQLTDKGVMVQVHKRIAVVWGPYNLWINNTFSHCGVDVFTLVKTKAGWKIASLAYSMENEGCDEPGR